MRPLSISTFQRTGQLNCLPKLCPNTLEHVRLKLHCTVGLRTCITNGPNFTFAIIPQRYDICAIWAYLRSLLFDLRHIGIDSLVVTSDGPTTQYKKRTNVYLINAKTRTYGFNRMVLLLSRPRQRRCRWCRSGAESAGTLENELMNTYNKITNMNLQRRIFAQ